MNLILGSDVGHCIRVNIIVILLVIDGVILLLLIHERVVDILQRQTELLQEVLLESEE